MNNRIFIQYFLLTFFISQVAGGQNPDSLSRTTVQDTLYKSFRLFEDEKPVELTLRFDLMTFLRTRSKEEYMKAEITLRSDNKDSVTRKIRIRSRGEFRNRYCSFAPVELNFKKTDFGYSDLNRILKIKLVPECRAGMENENYVLREYLVYKLFNVFTDTSFRVRLLNVTYIDTENNRKPVQQYGFFIEPIEMLSARTNTIQINTTTLNQKSILQKVMDRVAIFNYMIGNYDWAVPGLHNIKVLLSKIPETNQLGIAVPHDFDWTGLVNPDYAIPPEYIGVQTVRERKFFGVCRSKEVFRKDLLEFAEKKEELYKIVNEFPYLKQKEKKDITGYLDEFFDQIGGEKLIYNFQNTCKNF